MRLHGDRIIRRRENVKFQSDYHNYVPDLRTDFYHMCGYCGKHEMISHRGMEPDHFVPDNIDHSRSCDYANLVYSCFTCNRKKLGKWPTSNKDLPHDGNVGFVDPATEEFDEHLGRNENGVIEYYTPVGKYMYKAFKFDIRPTHMIWKASELYQLSSELEKEIDLLPQEKREQFIKIITDLHALQRYLFEHKE